MEKVTSRDGTLISYYRGGSGPPLVLVHGTSGTYTRWARVLPLLEEQFTVYALDRRGRGESGDSPTYAIEREFEDVAAVLEAIGEPAHLLGHSFGGICALEAGLLAPNLQKLVLYEGVPIPGRPMHPEGLLDRLEALQDAGDSEGLLTTFYRELLQTPPDKIEQFRSLPEWPTRVAAAHTLPRELRALEAYAFDPRRFEDFQIPTLLLLGGESPRIMKTASEAMDKVLPNSRIATMPGQGHLAYVTAPALFVEEVGTFLQ